MWREYLFPTSVEEAVAMLARYGGEARIITGGTDLVLQSQRGKCPSQVMVDITRIPSLDYIEERDGFIYIGALATHGKVAASPLIREKASVLAEACGHVGGPQIRNVATLAGNVINALPAADGAVALFALDAEAQVVDPDGVRWEPISRIYKGVGVCLLDPCLELVTALRFPVLGPHYASAFERLARRQALALPIVNAAVVVSLRDGVFHDVRIAVGPVAPAPFRATKAEKALVGQSAHTMQVERAAKLAAEDAHPRDSAVRGSQEYRKAMVAVLVRRALTRAVNPASQRQKESRTVSAAMDKGAEISEVWENLGGLKELHFRVNGQAVAVEVAPDDMLAFVLRDKLSLIGTKIGCAEGECGACTVLVDGKAVTSCIYPAWKAQGKEITTIEGLSQDNQLHVIQQAFIDCAASQCGYCTPGMIMSAKALLDANPNPSRAAIEAAISGNLCRCTGYYQIVEAIQLAATRLAVQRGAGDGGK